VTRLVMWWIGLAASVVLVVAALANQSGTCVDSAAAGSSCRIGGSGGLLLLGLAVMALSVWMLEAYLPHSRSHRPAKTTQLRANGLSGGIARMTVRTRNGPAANPFGSGL
jgi:hypothetical protein